MNFRLMLGALCQLGVGAYNGLVYLARRTASVERLSWLQPSPVDEEQASAGLIQQ
jgi:hypothetical protein